MLHSDKMLDAMAIENQKTDSTNLNFTWHERIKNIRALVKRCKKNSIDYSQETLVMEKAADVLSENELFATPVKEELSAQQIFTGDKNLYKYLENIQTAASTKSSDTERISTPLPEYKRFSFFQKILAAAIVLIGAVLLHAVLKSLSAPPNQTLSASNQTPVPEQQVAKAVRVTDQQTKRQDPILDSRQPLSLKVAQTFYLNGDYAQALDTYEKLYNTLSTSPKEDLTRDFFQMQMALCIERTNDYIQAGHLFKKILKSNSPALRVIAYYHCSLLEMKKKQYLNARTKAYQALALIDAIDFDKNWALSLKRDCHFLAAEALTRKVLSFCDVDKDIPDPLWSNFSATDESFVELSETQLQTFLNSGSEQLNQAALAPQIRQLGHQTGPARYDVTCNGASVEELMARFAANAGLDIHWALDPTEIGIRKRVVSLHLSATKQQFVTIASGCVGLLARLNEKGVIDIFNPADCSYVSEQISLLSAEAVYLWQKFLLRFPGDTHFANVHFALGLLQTLQGRFAEPIAEYKLVANRFSNSPLAPYALLNLGKLKNSLQDYAGGREDLRQLVEQFPDTEIVGEAYLYLADTTAKAGRKTEAVRLYRKVYNLGLSLESQVAATLGAGKCSYDTKDYESTAKWLTRYIQSASGCKNKDSYSAYFLLGKAQLALENPKAACDAFQNALQAGSALLVKEEYIEIISAMVEAYMQQAHFVQALDILEGIHPVPLSQKESTEILLLKAKVLQAIGLVDKVIVLLSDRAEFISDPQLKTRVSLELADCFVNKGNFELASKNLAEILVAIEPGLLAHKVALKLAGVSLKLGQESQTASICLQLLDLEPPEQIKQKALELLAVAYNQQKDYDRAALALLGQWK